MPDELPRQGRERGRRPHRRPPHAPGPDGEHWIPTKEGDLAGAVVVTLPMEQTIKAINMNRAMLITAALITAIVAMLSSYIIVRYVIVKPVKHLRDVSDAIAAGRLTIRSQIETGDEFEELSHAFNRMLYNLVAMQQALREVNNDLDKKVDELAQAEPGSVRDEPPQERLSGDHEPRAAHAAQFDHRFLRGSRRRPTSSTSATADMPAISSRRAGCSSR